MPSRTRTAPARPYRRIPDRVLRAAVDDAAYRTLLRKYHGRLVRDLVRLLRSDVPKSSKR